MTVPKCPTFCVRSVLVVSTKLVSHQSAPLHIIEGDVYFCEPPSKLEPDPFPYGSSLPNMKSRQNPELQFHFADVCEHRLGTVYLL